MTFYGLAHRSTRIPTVPNKIAMERSYDWFKDNAIYTVPFPNRGVMRRVYPGFLQLGGFISMNQGGTSTPTRIISIILVEGDCDSDAKTSEFYDEYLAVLDLTAEFYLQTIRDVFQEFKLPKRELVHRGRLVKPEAIKSVALMTVEGENDDISGIGQTQAAHDLCINIPQLRRNCYIPAHPRAIYPVYLAALATARKFNRMRIEFYLNFFNREREAQFSAGQPQYNSQQPNLPRPHPDRLTLIKTLYDSLCLRCR